MAKSGVIDRDLGLKEIKAELKKLKSMSVKVGIVEGHNKTEDGVNIAEYAAFNEEGTQHIPSRPFIRSWVDNHQEQIDKVMTAAFNSVVSGKRNAEDALKRIGEFAQSGIKDNIIVGNFKPNSPKTIAKKGSSKPLIDTGTLRNSIRYEVVEK